MKKTNKAVALGIIFFGSIIFSISDTAKAAELNLETESISVEKENVAKDNWEIYLKNMLLKTRENISDFYLGHGFTIDNPSEEEIVGYPIVKKENKEIAYVLQIDSENQIILSQKFGEVLNDLSNTTTDNIDNAPTIGLSDQTIYSQSRNQIETLLGNDSINLPASKKNNSQFESVTDVLETPNKITTFANFDSSILPWKAYEIQKEKPWCSWYVETGILNNLANKQILTAEQMLKAQYPNATATQLNDVNWITKQNLYNNFTFLKNKYGMDVKLKTAPPTFTEVKNELKTRKAPFQVDLNSTSGNITESHAIVQMGYTASTSGISSEKPYYYYWNPWWDDTFIVSSAATHMQLGSGKYKPFRFAYNFSKPKTQSLSINGGE